MLGGPLLPQRPHPTINLNLLILSPQPRINPIRPLDDEGRSSDGGLCPEVVGNGREERRRLLPTVAFPRSSLQIPPPPTTPTSSPPLPSPPASGLFFCAQSPTDSFLQGCLGWRDFRVRDYFAVVLFVPALGAPVECRGSNFSVSLILLICWLLFLCLVSA